MVAQYITTQLILDLCTEVDRRPGEQVYKQWWYQEGIDHTIERKVVAEAEGGEAGIDYG